MNPYKGATVLVNVAPDRNNGSTIAPAIVSAVLPSGRLNVRVLYDESQLNAPHPYSDYIPGVAFHGAADPAEANKQGLYGAFWPQPQLQQEIATILTNQENIMSGLTDLQDANTAQAAAIAAMQAEWTTFLADVTAALSNADSDAAVESAAQLVAQQTAAISAQTAAMQAADPANASTSAAPAAPAAPASGTAGSTVNAGDAGSSV
jgi:hypothetical protein